MALTHLAVTGHFNATWGGSALGRTDDGFKVSITLKGEELKFEEYMENLIDLILQGAEVSVEFVAKEWKAAGLKSALWPHSATFGTLDCPGGEFAVGDGFASALVLTAAPCTNAGKLTAEDTWTFHKTLIAPDVASEINLNNSVRTVQPLRFNCFLENVAVEPAEDYQFFSLA